MSAPALGAYVTHAKLPELGPGEILAIENGTVRIRFASGDRSFLLERVEEHLTTTVEAPEPPAAAKTAKRSRAAAKKKAPSQA